MIRYRTVTVKFFTRHSFIECVASSRSEKSRDFLPQNYGDSANGLARGLCVLPLCVHIFTHSCMLANATAAGSPARIPAHSNDSHKLQESTLVGRACPKAVEHAPELYKADRPIAHAFIRRTCDSWVLKRTDTFEPWVKVLVGATIINLWSRDNSGAIRHVKSVQIVPSASNDDCWSSVAAIQASPFECEKKEQREFARSQIPCSGTREEDWPCIPIRSTASTAQSARCWIACWTPRRSLSGDPRASPALAATTARRATTDLSDDTTR